MDVVVRNVSQMTTTGETGYKFASAGFQIICEYYNNNIHRPLALLICAFGTVSNSLNIAVLTRKSMRCSAVNVLLTGLSCAQLGLVVVYIVQLINDLLVSVCFRGMFTYRWTLIKLVIINLTIIFHIIALSHTVLLAVVRFLYINLAANQTVQPYIRLGNVRRAVISIYVVIPVVCLPLCFSTKIKPLPHDEEPYGSCSFEASQAAPEYYLDFTNEFLLKLSLWMSGIVFKIIPCILITVLSCFLICSLRARQKRSSVMLLGPARKRLRRLQKHNKTTRLMITIVLLFTAVELPHGLLCFLVGVLGQNFAYEVYNNLGDFINMLTLLYSSINFVLCCAMSSQFLATFQCIFCGSRGPNASVNRKNGTWIDARSTFQLLSTRSSRSIYKTSSTAQFSSVVQI